MDDKKPAVFRTIISMMINPATALKTTVAGVQWYFSVAVSAIAFGLFFLQTGLDLYKTGQKDVSFVVLSGGAGLLFGAILIPILGGIIWGILKIAKSNKDIKWAISSFCLSYSGALIYGIIGIIFSLVFSWKTSVAFGVTGVLWAIGPMIMTIREMTEGKNSLSIPIATVISGIVLLSWSVLGQL